MVNFYWEVSAGDLVITDPSLLELDITISGPVTIIAHFDACTMVDTDLVSGPIEVQEGQIAQYAFSNGVVNELEWSVSGGEVLWTSGFDNSIAILWDYGVTEGSIIVGAVNESGELECHTLSVNIIESAPPLGVMDLSLEKRVSIFPNPTNGLLNILTTSTEERLVVFIQD